MASSMQLEGFGREHLECRALPGAHLQRLRALLHLSDRFARLGLQRSQGESAVTVL